MAPQFTWIFAVTVVGGLAWQSAMSAAAPHASNTTSPTIQVKSLPEPDPADLDKHMKEINDLLKKDTDGTFEHMTVTTGKDKQGNPTRTLMSTVFMDGKPTLSSALIEDNATGMLTLHTTNYAYHKKGGKLEATLDASISYNLKTKKEESQIVDTYYDNAGKKLTQKVN